MASDDELIKKEALKVEENLISFRRRLIEAGPKSAPEPRTI
jgi:hypothetical protein